MKNKTIFSFSLLSIVLLIASISCKKNSDTVGNDLTDLNRVWQTTVFGGANDTLNIAVNTISVSVFVRKSPVVLLNPKVFVQILPQLLANGQ